MSSRSAGTQLWPPSDSEDSQKTAEDRELETPKEVVESVDQLVDKVEEIREESQDERSWVRREFETTKAVVREVLKKNPRSEGGVSPRNSDKFLIWFIKHEVEGKDLNDFSDYKDSTNPETIRRVRQEIQNDDGEFLPTDVEVARQRKFKEEEVKEYYSSRSLDF